jgi:hypothetical protein
MRLVVYTPLGEQNSIVKLQKLIDTMPQELLSA